MLWATTGVTVPLSWHWEPGTTLEARPSNSGLLMVSVPGWLASQQHPMSFLLFSWLFHHCPMTGAKVSGSQQLYRVLNIP